MLDTSMMPAREASTPMSFLIVNFSTRSMDPNNKVQTPVRRDVSYESIDIVKIILLVEVKIVELATVVYSRHAATK